MFFGIIQEISSHYDGIGDRFGDLVFLGHDGGGSSPFHMNFWYRDGKPIYIVKLENSGFDNSLREVYERVHILLMIINEN